MESHQIHNLVKSWKKYHPEEFFEAVGEINQGNSIEAYFLFKNFISMIDPTIKIDSINKFKIYANILTLDKQKTHERM